MPIGFNTSLENTENKHKQQNGTKITCLRGNVRMSINLIKKGLVFFGGGGGGGGA